MVCHYYMYGNRSNTYTLHLSTNLSHYPSYERGICIRDTGIIGCSARNPLFRAPLFRWLPFLGHPTITPLLKPSCEYVPSYYAKLHYVCHHAKSHNVYYVCYDMCHYVCYYAMCVTMYATMICVTMYATMLCLTMYATMICVTMYTMILCML